MTLFQKLLRQQLNVIQTIIELDTSHIIMYEMCFINSIHWLSWLLTKWCQHVCRRVLVLNFHRCRCQCEGQNKNKTFEYQQYSLIFFYFKMFYTHRPFYINPRPLISRAYLQNTWNKHRSIKQIYQHYFNIKDYSKNPAIRQLTCRLKLYLNWNV